jgi:cytoskeletal protein RodZ
MQPPPKKRRSALTIVLIIVSVVLVLCVGSAITIGVIARNGASNLVSSVNATSTAIDATTNADLQGDDATATADEQTVTAIETPSVPNGDSAPTSSQIDPDAAKIITQAQTTSAIDSNYKPTDSKSSFNVGDDVYVTFTTTGQKGYILAKWYLDGVYAQSNDPLADQNGETNGYVSLSVSLSGSGETALYWCTKSDCSDATLAQIVTWTVS